ncbi:hypothetical protein C8R45DRAFT_951381 [Mycena sanguinolenta]|nr:hypothetical protein C8R45DRAFT_951381 [Mycena sanguinolenta]
MVDWLLLSTLLAHQPRFDLARSSFLSVRSVAGSFPDRRFAFGDAGCDRLTFPTSDFLLDACPGDEWTAQRFAAECLIGMSETARGVKAGELFIIILSGHGEYRDNQFYLYVSTTPKVTGDAWLSKEGLEQVARRCVGDVVIVVNSCHSGALESPYWRLICAAGPHELSDALTPSHSEKTRGSAFARALSEISPQQGLSTPFPRSSPLPPDGLEALPPLQPPHSFAGAIPPQALPPSSTNVPDLLTGILARRHLLVMWPPAELHQFGFGGQPWWEALPLALPQSLIDKIGFQPEGLEFMTKYNAMREVPTPAHTGGSSVESTVTNPNAWSQDHSSVDRAAKELLILAPSFVKLPPSTSRDVRNGLTCSQYLSKPSSVPRHETHSVWYILRARHLQSIVTQLTVVELGWCPVPESGALIPFLSPPTWEPRWFGDELVREGGVLDALGERVVAASPGTANYTDHACISWIIEKWRGVGGPVVAEQQLEAAVDNALRKAPGFSLVNFL